MKTVFIVLFAGMVGCVSVQPVSAADAVTFEEKVLWSFGSGTDGQRPSGLIHVNGTFYGTTVGGGVYGDGTVFAFAPSTGTEKVLYFFCIKGEYCLDGSSPWAGLIDVKDKLYGTTFYGGDTSCSGGCGTVFSLDLNTGKEKVVCSFLGSPDGRNPTASLINVNGILYGTTDSGGTGSQGLFGTAFALDRKTGAETVLYSFCGQEHCTDGRNSASGLIDVNGTLYGTTAGGGANYTSCQNAGCGTVYALDPGTGTETVLYSFAGGTDGWSPSNASLIDVNGMLYGTTYWGGGTGCYPGTGCGTVFSLDPSTGTETVLYSFCSQTNCTDGAEPSAGLIDVNGTLYGTTQAGGTGKGGTVFSIDPSTGTETVLYSFCSQESCADGAGPIASLIAVNGKFYGTTAQGGAYRYGTVFELKQDR